MRKCKFLLSFVLTLSLLFTATVPAFAAETSSVETKSVSSTYAQNGLLYRTGVTPPTGGVYYAVTPRQGAKLNVWVKPTNGVRVSVCHANDKYNILYTRHFSGETDAQVLSNCDGGTYWVSFYNDGGNGSVDFLIYERY